MHEPRYRCALLIHRQFATTRLFIRATCMASTSTPFEFFTSGATLYRRRPLSGEKVCAHSNAGVLAHKRRPLRAFSANPRVPSVHTHATTTHVLTAYMLTPVLGQDDGTAVEATLPPLRVTPLRLTDDAGKECVQALWSAVRLLREGQHHVRDGESMELFAQSGSRDVGEVLRFGAPNINLQELARKALGRDSTREVIEGEAFDLQPSMVDVETNLAYGEILREALYEYALNTVGELFDVSREGRTGVLLTAKLVRGSWAAIPVSDAVAVLDQYTLDIEIKGEKSARILCTLGHELRSPLTVRQILDDPALMDFPEGSEVVALGGPHLQGQLSYTKIGDKKIGDARDELKGESLLSYHRKRYPARVKLLENARNDDDAVQLVQPGRAPTAYPAELLSPVIKMSILDANTRDAVSETCAVSPFELQKRITTIRRMLSQPFSTPFQLHLDEKMQRLPGGKSLSTTGAINTRKGDLQSGPAVLPKSVVQVSSSESIFKLMLGNGEDDAAAQKYLAELVKDIDATLCGWNMTDNDVRLITSKVRSAVVERYDDASFNAVRSSFTQSLRQKSGSSVCLVPLPSPSSSRPFVETGVRQASSRVQNANVRWAADAKSHDVSRLCFALLVRYGGQATTFAEPIMSVSGDKKDDDVYFIGASIKPGLPIVDKFGCVIAQQSGAPLGAVVTTAVRAAIDNSLAKIVIHHAGQSDAEDIKVAVRLADEHGITIHGLIDVIERDFGRILGWSKDKDTSVSGCVTQPDRGFWSILDKHQNNQDDDIVLVTTGGGANEFGGNNNNNFTARGVARPLRLCRRLGDIPGTAVVESVLRLCEIDVHYTGNNAAFRLPCTLRPIMQSNTSDILLLRHLQ